MNSTSIAAELYLPSRKINISHNFISVYKCPKCGVSTDYRIRKSPLIKKLFPFLSLKRYWCPSCFNRFYVVQRKLHGISFDKAPQNMPLDPVYAICWFHAIPISAAHGFKDNTYIYLVTGLNLDGSKDILSLCISDANMEVFWSRVIDNLKSRGMQDILITCSDLAADLHHKLADSFPEAIHLHSFSRQIRLCTQYISVEQASAFANDLKNIYEALNETVAREYLQTFSEKWSSSYGYAVNNWRELWPELSRCLSLPCEIRSILFTDQVLDKLEYKIEGLKQLKGAFPDQKITLKNIEQTVRGIQKAGPMTPVDWVKIKGQFKQVFGDRCKTA